jgi:membrane protein required for colicin V production
MTWIDWIIVAVVAGSVLGGLLHGFLRSAFELAGLFAGVVLALWNYQRVGERLLWLVHPRIAADAVGFCLVVLGGMCTGFVLGYLLSKTLRKVGLGCLDRVAGAIFGLLQGIVMAIMGILLTLAFFPAAGALQEARLPKLLFEAFHLSMDVSPEEVARKVREGLKELNAHSPNWMKPKNE